MNTIQLTKEQKSIRRRIAKISWQKKLSHLGSCFSAVDLILAVYKIKKKNEKFVLSSGHAGVALYAVLENQGLLSPEQTESLFVHPDRNKMLHLDVSTGSLGQGLPIAVGMAIANRKKNVYCLISDGECAEGSIWEALRIAGEQNLSNLKILVNANGWGAYDPINTKLLAKRLAVFGCHFIKTRDYSLEQIKKSLKIDPGLKPLLIFVKTINNHLPCLNGLDAHYCLMIEEDYKLALKLWQ